MQLEKVSDLKSAGIKKHREGNLDEALKYYSQYVALRPGDAGAVSNIGAILRKKGHFRQALSLQKQAYAIDPASESVLINYANILSDLGEYEASIELRETLLEMSPQRAEQHSLISKCYRGMGDYRKAIEVAETAADRFPEFSDLRLQSAMSRLALGEYEAGFEDYRARWDAPEMTRRKLPVPEWDGQDVRGKTVLVLPEQGFGDCVLMARFLPALKALGCHVIFYVEKPVARILAHCEGVDEISRDKVEAIKRADYWLNMMDLGRIALKTDADMLAPTQITVPQDATERARFLNRRYPNVRKVGVVWTGSTTYKGNAFRSFSHTDFMPLTDLPNVQLFSLYKGPNLDAYFADGTAATIIDGASRDRDFADCAAMMQEMDVIVTSDTATAHIAGSLGLKTWVVLHRDPFWVYRYSGDSTPWYPTMRLFRQKTILEWGDVMTEVKTALQEEFA